MVDQTWDFFGTPGTLCQCNNFGQVQDSCNAVCTKNIHNITNFSKGNVYNQGNKC